MKFSQANSDLFVPDRTGLPEALQRTTHLGIGAHQDDLEFMALHGILECYQKEELWFGGITCTDGSGSARSGPFAVYSDEQMRAVRMEEQKQAARIGGYGFMAQLGHSSSHTRDHGSRESLVRDLVMLLEATCPAVVYTHNPFDKHATHVGVLRAVLEAIRQLPEDVHPQTVFGCEVWRGLDWLPDHLKVVHDVSAHPELAAKLSAVFASQIAGGKRFDLAVEGRRRANATFLNSHAVDSMTRASYAVDLTPVIRVGGPDLGKLMNSVLNTFNDSILAGQAE